MILRIEDVGIREYDRRFREESEEACVDWLRGLSSEQRIEIMTMLSIMGYVVTRVENEHLSLLVRATAQ